MIDDKLKEAIKELITQQLGRKGVEAYDFNLDSCTGKLDLDISLWSEYQTAFLGHWSGTLADLDNLLDRLKAKENK